MENKKGKGYSKLFSIEADMEVPFKRVVIEGIASQKPA